MTVAEIKVSVKQKNPDSEPKKCTGSHDVVMIRQEVRNTDVP
jgi:hypothetical protein